jgi:chromosome segregation ATPase
MGMYGANRKNSYELMIFQKCKSLNILNGKSFDYWQQQQPQSSPTSMSYRGQRNPHCVDEGDNPPIVNTPKFDRASRRFKTLMNTSGSDIKETGIDHISAIDIDIKSPKSKLASKSMSADQLGLKRNKDSSAFASKCTKEMSCDSTMIRLASILSCFRGRLLLKAFTFLRINTVLQSSKPIGRNNGILVSSPNNSLIKTMSTENGKDEVEGLKSEIVKLKEQLSASRKSLSFKCQQLEASEKRRIEAHIASTKESEGYKKQINICHEQIFKLNQSLAEMDDAKKVFSQEKAIEDSLKVTQDEEIHRKNEEIINWKEQNEVINAQMEEKEKEIQSFKSMETILNAKCDSLQQLIDEERNKNEQFHGDLLKTSSEKDLLILENKTFRENNHILIANCEKLNDAIASLQNQNENLERVIESQLKELSAANEKVEKCEKSLMSLKISLVEKSDELRSCNKRIQEIRDLLNSKEKLIRESEAFQASLERR